MRIVACLVPSMLYPQWFFCSNHLLGRSASVGRSKRKSGPGNKRTLPKPKIAKSEHINLTANPISGSVNLFGKSPNAYLYNKEGIYRGSGKKPPKNKNIGEKWYINHSKLWFFNQKISKIWYSINIIIKYKFILNFIYFF